VRRTLPQHPPALEGGRERGAGQICSPNNSLIGNVSGKTAFVDFIEQIRKNQLALERGVSCLLDRGVLL
jgi:hypothetical protein